MSDELSQILAGQKYQIETLEKIDQRLKDLNGTVRSNQIRVTVLEQFCQEQVKPALGQLMNMRLEMAKWAALGGGAGTVAAIAFALGKLLAWW